MNIRSLVIGLAGAAMVPTASKAAVLAHEPFDYSANLGTSLNTRNGGSGWGGAWADGDTDVTVASTNASLSYPATSSLNSTGSRIEISATDSSAQATRSLGTPMSLATSGQNYYSSALMRRSAETGQLSTVSFFGTTNLRWFYGIDADGKFSVAVDPSQTVQRATSTSLSAVADTTYLVVARFRTNTGPGNNDEVFLKVFAPGDVVAEPVNDAGWDLTANGNSGVTLDSIRLDFSNAAGQTNQFDELRIGTTFADVAVPEPASLGLLAVAMTGLLSRRTRRPASPK